MVSYLDEKAMSFGIEITISWPDTTPSGGRRHIRGRHNRTVQAGLSTELTRASPGTYQRTVCAGSV